MEHPLTGAFADLLREHRDLFNTLYAFGKANVPPVADEEFRQVLRDFVAPVVEAIAPAFPEQALPVARHLFELSQELLGRKFLGPAAKIPALPKLLSDLLIRLGSFTAAAPAIVPGLFCNALCRLSRVAPGAGARWVDQMAEAGKHLASVDDLLAYGRTLAWTLGIPDFRESALAQLPGLPLPLVAKTFGFPENALVNIDVLCHNLRTFPWLKPHQALIPEPRVELMPVGMSGGFAGFGGPFHHPPEVFVSEGRIVGIDAENARCLQADVFGHSWGPLQAEMPTIDRAGTATGTKNGAMLEFHGKRLEIPVFSHCTSVAFSDTTVALTIPFSHQVFLFGLAVPE
jgi:hypothetical protein